MDIKTNYLDKVFVNPDKVKKHILKEMNSNIVAFSEEIDELHSMGEWLQVNLCTIVSEYNGWRISTEILKLLEIEHEEEEAVELIDDYTNELNEELKEFLKDVPDTLERNGVTYNFTHYFDFMENNGYCLIQYITRED